MSPNALQTTHRHGLGLWVSGTRGIPCDTTLLIENCFFFCTGFNGLAGRSWGLVPTTAKAGSTLVAGARRCMYYICKAVLCRGDVDQGHGAAGCDKPCRRSPILEIRSRVYFPIAFPTHLPPHAKIRKQRGKKTGIPPKPDNFPFITAIPVIN